MQQEDQFKIHFTSGKIVKDIIIGMSDGLTVPFALAAGLSGAVSQTSIIIIAGLAEIAAGSDIWPPSTKPNIITANMKKN